MESESRPGGAGRGTARAPRPFAGVGGQARLRGVVGRRRDDVLAGAAGLFPSPIRIMAENSARPSRPAAAFWSRRTIFCRAQMRWCRRRTRTRMRGSLTMPPCSRRSTASPSNPFSSVLPAASNEARRSEIRRVASELDRSHVGLDAATRITSPDQYGHRTLHPTNPRRWRNDP